MTSVAEKSSTRRWLGFLCVCSAILDAPSAAAQPAIFDLQAHRGGRGETTEESLRAFAKSLELGVTTIELDVVLTGDSQPLVWHDPIISPAKCVDTGPVIAGDPQYPYVGKPVRDLALMQIRTLDCGLPQAAYPGAEVVRGNVIATLPEVFALGDSYHADVRYNIEAKTDVESPSAAGDAQRLVEVILTAVRAAGKIGAVDIQSFDWRMLPMVRRAEPAVPLVALWDHTTVAVGDPVTAATAVGADVLAPEYTMVDRDFVERAHALGRRVIPWTVNDADAMRAQIALGVDGVITDYPATLRKVMAELGMPLPPAYHAG